MKSRMIMKRGEVKSIEVAGNGGRALGQENAPNKKDKPSERSLSTKSRAKLEKDGVKAMKQGDHQRERESDRSLDQVVMPQARDVYPRHIYSFLGENLPLFSTFRVSLFRLSCRL